VKYGNRSQLFVTTKVSPRNHGEERAYNSVMDSLRLLQLDYVDLVLIHWPGQYGKSTMDDSNPSVRLATWRALERIKREGKAKYIGVSNFTIAHLNKLLPLIEEYPSVNQVELHTYLNQKDLRKFCEEKNIIIQAYSPLGRGEILSEPLMHSISLNHMCSPAQVALSWIVNGLKIPLICKASSRERMEENLKALDITLTEEEIESISALSKNYHICWDPSVVK